MGWFESPTFKGVMLGDDPFDETYNFLKSLSKVYQQELQRNPTLNEVRALLEISLRVNGREVLADFEDQEVTQFVVKTAKKRKDQPYSVGDIFAVPLGGTKYAYGRIMAEEKSMGTLIEIFRQTTEGIRPPTAISQSGRLFNPIYTVRNSWVSWRWTIVLSDKSYKMKDESLQFVMGEPSIGYKIRQDGKTRKASPQEIDGLEELILWNPGDVELRIRGELKALRGKKK